MTKPLLHRRGSDRTDDLHYEISGHSHLVVEPEYCGSSKPQYWTVRDTRFSVGLDRWTRWQVLVAPSLADVRSWIRAGGPALWDPERRKTDRKWRPIPDGWQAGEAGSEVPRRTDPGVRPGQRVAGEHRGSIRSEGRREDRRRVAEPGDPPDREFRPEDVAGKKYAVCPGYVTSGGQRHFIGFGALTWLYGVGPSECLHIPLEMQGEKLPAYMEELVWLHPQGHLWQYEEMREELARGDDAFKLDHVP